MVYEVEQLRREQAIHSLPILLDQPMPRRKDHRKSKETTRNTMAMAENMVIAGSQVDASRRSSIARLSFISAYRLQASREALAIEEYGIMPAPSSSSLRGTFEVKAPRWPEPRSE